MFNLKLPKLHKPKRKFIPKHVLEKRNHAERYPAMHLHPNATIECKRHWKQPYETDQGLVSLFRYYNYGKGQVFFTNREGGIWQKWPWNWVPGEERLLVVKLMRDEALGIDPICGAAIGHPSYVEIRKPNKAGLHDENCKTIRVHSMLINGRRWDCINGWTD